MKFFATAPRGMVDLLLRELTECGAEQIKNASAGATFQGDLETAYRVCLWSRIANRVLLPVTTVPAATPEQLYQEVKAIRWEKHLRTESTFAVDCTSVNAAITHSRYAALKVKDAVADRFRERFGARPDVDVEKPDLRINLHLSGEHARLSIDLSGGSLHRRGYRTEGVTAPLKENLASAILLLAGWPEVAKSGGALLDPMCGSGTLLIEAAMIAADIAPGLQRAHYGFMGWRRHDPLIWDRLRAEASARREQGLKTLPAIRGFDIDAQAIASARANIAEAGLSAHLQVSRAALGAEPGLPLTPSGLVVVNPPYGERLGEVEELRSLYKELGQYMRHHLPGWHGAVFTGNPELAAYTGLPAAGSTELYNGPIVCRLFRYRIPETKLKDALATEPRAPGEGAGMFANRLKKNLKHLTKWAKREGVGCFRVYDADLPEYAVAVDIYGGKETHVHVQEYQAPRHIDAEKAMQRLQDVLAVVTEVLEVPLENVHLKVRRRQRGRAQYEKQDSKRRFYEVSEGPCRFLVNFTDYLDTGLFLDHRITRAMIGQLARGRDFLNLFAYTATATVCAAKGGARSTLTVDMSNTYLDWAQRNMRLNGFEGKEHEYVQADCLSWLEEKASVPGQRQHYGLIFIDPPTFSTSKRMEGTFDVQRDHVRLLKDAGRLLAPGGVIIFSNNYRKFTLEAEALGEFLIEDISRATLPRDFERNPSIHGCWKLHLR